MSVALRCAVASLCAVPLVIGFSPSALAACGRPDLRFAVPDDGGTAIPVDARPYAVYAEPADYLGEPIQRSSPSGVESLVGAFDAVEHRLSTEAPGLEPDTEYTLAWPELRGFGSASRGLGRTVTFRTSAVADLEAPEFSGIERIEWDVLHERDECTDEFEDRFRFELRVGRASDDGGSENLALLLFQTRGGAVTDAPELVSVTRFPADGSVRVELGTEEALGDVCFAGLVRDLVGKTSASAHLERCVSTTAPPFFYGCSVGHARSAGPVSWVSLLALLWLTRRRLAP